MTYLQQKMLQVLKDRKPSASWIPQHLVLLYASSINLLLQELRINIPTTVLFLLFQLMNSYLCYSYPILFASSPNFKKTTWKGIYEGPKQILERLLFHLCLKTFVNESYTKVRYLPEQFPVLINLDFPQIVSLERYIFDTVLKLNNKILQI